MKADEVLERYREGKRDFRRVDLRGQSFKGKNLSGADFSEADVRGANFTNANLSGANFHGALAGLQHRWAIGLVLASWIISGISGIFSVLPGYYVSLALDKSDLESFSAGITSLIVLTVFFIVTIRHGLAAGFIAVAGAGAVVAGAEVGAILVAGGVAGAGARAGAGAGFEAEVRAGGVAGARAGARAGAVAIAVIVTGAVTVTVTGVIAIAVAVAVAVAVGGAGAVVVAGAGAVAMLGVYVGWRSLAGDEKHAWVRSFAIAFAAKGGTSFRGADLTNADFRSATLKSTDFRGAILIRTCWHQAKKLDRVRPGTTYLRNVQLQQWLIGKGQNKDFERQDLRGVNLKGANLVDASFVGADISEASLQDADLSRAKLVQAQLDKTNFTGATLTGAYIQDWNITSGTKFNGVRCEYVYMRLPTKENPDPLRKPDNNKEVFADGEFGDFIQPIFDALDLYHNQGVDPRAIAVAFKEVAENNPDAELEIVAIERRGEDKILIRAKTTATASKSELSREYFLNYNQVKELAEKDFQELIAANQSQIMRLENMVLTALERPNFYAETVQHQGDIVSQKSETSHYDLRETKFGGGFAGTGGNQMGGTFHENSSNQNLQAQPQALVSNHIVCTQCGRQNPNTFNFCIKCGSKLTSPT